MSKPWKYLPCEHYQHCRTNLGKFGWFEKIRSGGHWFWQKKDILSKVPSHRFGADSLLSFDNASRSHWIESLRVLAHQDQVSGKSCRREDQRLGSDFRDLEPTFVSGAWISGTDCEPRLFRQVSNLAIYPKWNTSSNIRKRSGALQRRAFYEIFQKKG